MHMGFKFFEIHGRGRGSQKAGSLCFMLPASHFTIKVVQK
jgi:hypothetical protein